MTASQPPGPGQEALYDLGYPSAALSSCVLLSERLHGHSDLQKFVFPGDIARVPTATSFPAGWVSSVRDRATPSFETSAVLRAVGEQASISRRVTRACVHARSRAHTYVRTPGSHAARAPPARAPRAEHAEEGRVTYYFLRYLIS